ncbi:MAG: class I SAM-dependent methyltransferase [Chloroflexi bacterium]|nr:class I SAM-dependent methyltransferase [Chloroflexota bacterium]
MAYPVQSISVETRWQTAQHHELGFWRYTHQHGYDNLSWDELYYKQGNDLLSLASKVKPLSDFRDNTVIDLGCGPIGLPCYLKCHRAIGVDPLMAAYHLEFEHLRSTSSFVHWIAGRGEEVPLPDGIADVMFSRNVLDHVKNPEIWLKEFVRLLRPGGEISFIRQSE